VTLSPASALLVRSTEQLDLHPDENLTGVVNPDFLALGLGGTNMLAMLWSVAMGRRSVGVEMRGDPFLGVHWNIREDLYHQLGKIDQMMVERYGEDGVPRRTDGSMIKLSECFYSPHRVSGDVVADEVVAGYDTELNISGTINSVEFIDDRWTNGMPNRVVTILDPPLPPDRPDSALIRSDMTAVLDGPSVFQSGASEIQVLLRRYLEHIESQDLREGREPRVRLFTRHRAIAQDDVGLVKQSDGRIAVQIEALHELDFKDKLVRIRMPGSKNINIGVPELFMIAQGFHSDDAQRLGFSQSDVAVDHGDGRGPVVAQADFIAGLMEVLVDGRLRRRIASEFDDNGDEYWVRQIAVGHQGDPEVGWILVQVPDFKTFDPIAAGLVPEGTSQDSPSFFAAHQNMLLDYYLEQCSNILEIPKSELRRVQMDYGPKLFSLVERVGSDARVAANGVVAGDSFGNGHFLTSGGAMTGMIGHAARVLEYWQSRDLGVSPDQAIRSLADQISDDTHKWLDSSAHEYSEAIPINFGAERIAQISGASAIPADTLGKTTDSARRLRHSLRPLDPTDWRRLFLRNGLVLSEPLPALSLLHPALRPDSSIGGSGPSVRRWHRLREPASVVMIPGGRHSHEYQHFVVDDAVHARIVELASALTQALPVLALSSQQSKLVRRIADELAVGASIRSIVPSRMWAITSVLDQMLAAGCAGALGSGFMSLIRQLWDAAGFYAAEAHVGIQ
jgi:hypothetical protein